MNFYDTCLNVAKALEPLYGIDEKQDMMITFSLGNGIFRCPAEHTGLSSEAAQFLPKTSSLITFEHIFSRKQSAISIINAIRNGWSDERILLLIRSRCRVTVTLRSENQLLKPFQQVIDTHPRKIYELAGLKMVKWWGPKAYMVDGKQYHVYDKELIAKKYNVKLKDVGYRLHSAGKKWTDWKIVEANND